MKNIKDVKRSDLKKLNDRRSIVSFANYIWVSPYSVSRWDAIPRKYHRKALEWVETNNDYWQDFIDLLDIRR